MECLVELVKLSITMGTFTKDGLPMDSDKDLAHMFLTKYTDTRVNGETILFMEKENCLEMENCFSKANSRMD